ncbi:MAG: hypothetical protein JW881_06855 [Spirochaetales bacterium]|nr:hypothetical protein [Spirochaetales bacterium]
MQKERDLSLIKARISSQIRKMAYNGLRIILYEWNENDLKIHTTDNENVVKIANILQQRFPGWLNSVNISVCGETKVMQL